MSDYETKERSEPTEGEYARANLARLMRDDTHPEKPVLMTISSTPPAAPAARPAPQDAVQQTQAPVVSAFRDKPGDPHRNPMFGLLVKDDRDLTGLLAYSFYKLTKREWLTAFAAANDREPSADEIRAFILGEQTGRRIAGYRRQAEDALAGRAPEAGAPHQPPLERPRMETILQQFARNPGEPLRAPEPTPAAPAATPPQPGLKKIAGYLLLLLLLVGLLALVVNYAKTSFFAQ